MNIERKIRTGPLREQIPDHALPHSAGRDWCTRIAEPLMLASSAWQLVLTGMSIDIGNE